MHTNAPFPMRHGDINQAVDEPLIFPPLFQSYAAGAFLISVD